MADEVSLPNPLEGLTYGTYLRVPELLSLQHPVVGDKSHDEMLFIVIHQAYEIWFKQILFELDTVAVLVARGEIAEARRLTDRVVAIERVLVDQIHILETMLPRDFLHFRQALRPASGFQSAQFREVEFLSGLKDARYLRYYAEGSPEHAALSRRFAAPTLRDVLYTALRAQGYDVSDDADTDQNAFDRAVQSLLPIYRDVEKHFDLYHLCEALVAHDQWIAIWRFHHVRVVERVIGSKPGTGGSPGVGYLESTLNKRALPLLWAVRSSLSDEDLFGAYRSPTHNGCPV
jgi:tryptophan 2,3-dioxygenase